MGAHREGKLSTEAPAQCMGERSWHSPVALPLGGSFAAGSAAPSRSMCARRGLVGTTGAIGFAAASSLSDSFPATTVEMGLGPSQTGSSPSQDAPRRLDWNCMVAPLLRRLSFALRFTRAPLNAGEPIAANALGGTAPRIFEQTSTTRAASRCPQCNAHSTAVLSWWWASTSAPACTSSAAQSTWPL